MKNRELVHTTWAGENQTQAGDLGKFASIQISRPKRESWSLWNNAHTHTHNAHTHTHTHTNNAHTHKSCMHTEFDEHYLGYLTALTGAFSVCGLERVWSTIKAPVFGRNQNSTPQSIMEKAHGSLISGWIIAITQYVTGLLHPAIFR